MTLHGNRLAAIDLETTGAIAGYHEIAQIAVVPLSDCLLPDGRPFVSYVRPEFPGRADGLATDVNGLDLEELKSAPDQGQVADRLEAWFRGLGLPQGRRIVPLAHKWTFEFSFLAAWLGNALFEELFHYHARDAMTFALGLNDRAELSGRSRPFERVSLGDLCQRLGVANEHPHDALSDALAEAEVYRRLLLGY